MHPNVNLDDLRTTEYDFSMMQAQGPQQDAYNMQGDLDMFANAQFFDFDMGEMPENSPVYAENDGFNMGENGAPQVGHAALLNGDFQNGLANFPGGYAQAKLAAANRQLSLYSNGQASRSSGSSSGSSPASTATPHPVTPVATARKGSVSAVKELKTESEPTEEVARVAAEEDKRRRNTAASARFRVKKKQREQALEKNAKEMTDRVNELEARVAQLEMENKILKDLITEKSGKEVDMAEVQKKVKEATPEASSPRAAAGTLSSTHRPVAAKTASR